MNPFLEIIERIIFGSVCCQSKNWKSALHEREFERLLERLRVGLFLVDALGADVSALASGDEGVAIDEALDHRVLFLVVGIHLSVNHLLSCDGRGVFKRDLRKMKYRSRTQQKIFNATV